MATASQSDRFEHLPAAAEGAAGYARRLPLPRRVRRGAVRREGQVAAKAGAVVLPAADTTIQRTAELVERVEEIEVFVVTSETEALLLEQNLIKRHRPRFNIRLRDDKSYPYIAVTVGDEYPRVMFTRERHRKGVQYFGPYSSARKVRETLDVLNQRLPVPAVRGADAGATLGCAVPRLPHRPLRGALRGHCPSEEYAR